MIQALKGSRGLFGRILAILLLTVTVEFGVSTFLYEQASQFSVQNDEAHRLAEYLVLVRKFLSEDPVTGRAATARELTTDQYYVHWTPSISPKRPGSSELSRMQRDIIGWEPDIKGDDLRLWMTTPGNRSLLKGALKLPDGSWIEFGTRASIKSWDLSISRILLALVPALGFLGIAALLVRRTLQPLRSLSAAARQFAPDAHTTIPVIGTPEVRELITAFNDMQDRIRRLVTDRTQALAAVGHDLRTPIARLRLRTDRIDDLELHQAFDSDLSEMEAMVTSLLAYLRGEDDSEAFLHVDVAVLTETLVDASTDLGLPISYAGPAHLEAHVRPLGLKRALGNLIENAAHFGKTVNVSLRFEDAQLIWSVDDDGPGIPEDRLTDVLDPFTRIDVARARNTKGLGLGLTIASQILKKDGGTLTLENRSEGGLRARITLPRRA